MLHADPNRPYEAHYEDGTVRPVVALGVDPAIPEALYMLVLNETDGSVVAPPAIKGLRGVRPVGA